MPFSISVCSLYTIALAGPILLVPIAAAVLCWHFVVVAAVPGEHFHQTSTLLLLDGSLQQQSHQPSGSSSKSAEPPAGDLNQLQQYQAPALLAWAPEVFDGFENRYG
jgi:ABC-type microcin C transport system permease subunit YejB